MDIAAGSERRGAVLTALQYIDDASFLASSIAHLRQVCRQLTTWGREWRYHFGEGRTKTAVVALKAQTPPADLSVGGKKVETVATSPYLGALPDEDLRFERFLKQVLGRADAAPEELVHQAASLGLGPPVVAQETPQRVESKIFHAIAVLASHHNGAEHVENQFNKMQARWPTKILGGQGLRPGRWIWGIWEMGWSRRLGTRFVERAILDRARIRALPPEHPARVSLRAAADRSGTWGGSVKRMMMRVSAVTGLALPDAELGVADEESNTKETRRADVRNYKWKIFRPVLLEYDEANTVRIGEEKEGADLRLERGGPAAHGVAMPQGASRRGDWHHYRIWCLTG